jgi:hypothetical protein
MELRLTNIKFSEATVARRRKALGLKGSAATTKATPDAVKRQLVLDQMAKDPTGMQGPRTIKEGIAHDTGESVSRYVTSIFTGRCRI